MPLRLRLRSIGLAILLSLGLAGISHAQPAGIETDPLVSSIQTAIMRYNQDALFPLPFLEFEQLEELLAREVVIVTTKLPLLDEEDLRYRSIVYRIVDAEQVQVWLSALSPDLTEGGPVTEVRLADTGEGRHRSYQRIALPWPVKDRQWVIDVDLEIESAERTEGQAWVHWWNLAPDGRALARRALREGLIPGLDEDDFETAVYLPANTGAWIVIDLGGGHTLLGYQLTLVMGGWIPELLGQKFARGELERLLDGVASGVAERSAAYDPDRHPVRDGFGRLIPSLSSLSE